MKSEITEKEFAVIREISNNHQPNQRIIAKRVGISLGLTNLIIKRLIKKGYIKIKEVPPRTIQYILTPKGFAEKTIKTYRYTLQTIKTLEAIKTGIQEIVENAYGKGGRDFLILGNGELVSLTEIVFKNLNFGDVKITKTEILSNKKRPTCNLLYNLNGNQQRVDLLSEIARKNITELAKI